MISSNNTHVQNNAKAIANKISIHVSAHDNSNTAHSDIRNSINSKLDVNSVESMECTINYSDGTSETVELLKNVQSSWIGVY